MAVADQTILVYRGEDAIISGVMNPVVNINGWTLQFTAAKKLNKVAKLIGPKSATIVSGPAGTYTIPLTAAETTALTPGSYVWDLWRTDVGVAEVVAIGTFTVSGDARIPTS